MPKILVSLKKRQKEPNPRAVLVPDNVNVPNTFTTSKNEVADVICVNCMITYRTKSPATLANQVLNGKGSKLLKRLTSVNTATSNTENSFSIKSIRSEFGRSIQPHNKKIERLTHIL